MANPLKTLQESVIKNFENGAKGSVVPTFHVGVDSFFAGTKGDLPAEKMVLLKGDLAKIAKAMAEGMELTVGTVTVSVPVHATGYSSLFGVPVEKDAAGTLLGGLLQLMEQCEMALLLGCGFGKFSASSEAIKRAHDQLRARPETIHIPFLGKTMEFQIFSFDSNNNPKHGLLVDGMWSPYRALGIVRAVDRSIILAFQAKMDYGSGRWDLERFDVSFLTELAEKSSLFADAYLKVVGNAFNPTVINEIDSDTIAALKASPFFQQILNRVCSRWIH
ncbi:hypothetical protein A3E99_00435 [Candidatus Kaiserbacteria bacterium RIFCSPHIGHO2_12_FULL_54_16]|uniref:Uncharacterized protein n=2 Tax=Parcubacteria group TaxID=1794811 RepID=A0A0G1WNF0_9BACT|nr:MAG: hypothetical protein UX06_C0013G0009 [Candidatus Giovannonibacteria bacterium GW2011_GWA2_45_21]KKW20311.1 MAG: hypothetical protein UY61_C0038G0007 [Candidatus Adlerbacteria bacterium GW2011_GWC1_50_9]OGG67978.1 MAG: hypothetical protein A3E99_00435 [Candidatus Kaiserbacteria bacterium RIFCSPHIGHO2_12_FULL_54_16]